MVTRQALECEKNDSIRLADVLPHKAKIPGEVVEMV
jgi:predicted RNA-binding protein